MFYLACKEGKSNVVEQPGKQVQDFSYQIECQACEWNDSKTHVRLVDKSLTVNIVVTSALLRIYPCVSFFGSCCLGFSRQKGKRIYLMLNWQDHGSKSPWHYHKVGKEVRSSSDQASPSSSPQQQLSEHVNRKGFSCSIKAKTF